MIVTNETKLIPLSDVPKLAFLPRRRRGRKLHPSTVFRWAQRGLGGVRLETVRVGGTLCTTVEALHAFFLKTAGVVTTTPPQPTKHRQRDLERVRRNLDAAGF